MKKHLQAYPFKIYNASAGSGKTHTLVKEYLKIVLRNPMGFKNILAITFTNKAVNEMKERILTSLFDFSLSVPPKKNQSLYRELVSELKISSDDLRKKSGETLKLILHNYAYFDISTIDKFTHRVIRTFAKDLKLPQNFEPVVETDLLLNEAVSRVVQKAGSDKQLTKVLIEFALEKIEDDRSWDVTFDLNRIGNLIFQENHADPLEKMASKKMADFLELKNTVKKKLSYLEEQMISISNEVPRVIEENGLQSDDFSGGYFPKLMQRITTGDFKVDLDKVWVKKFDSEPLYPKRVSEGKKKTLDNLQPSFTDLFVRLQNFLFDYLFLKNVYGNIIPLTILSAIQKEVDAIGKERDQIPIFKFNQIISKEIKDQPAPFIYERLGEKYRHYFIDEFQDTSASQWNNLVPLIDNALASEGGSLFLVGDAKQAIYRWRGGRAEQLLNLSTLNENPFVVNPRSQILPVNYRSYDEVVKFNNEFFTLASTHLENRFYQKMFRDGNHQETNDKKGGLVNIDFLKKENGKNIENLYCQKTYDIINEIGHKGYRLNDICILVRSNKKGVVLADFLTEKRVPVISSESLLLNSSQKVRFLIYLLQYGSGFQERELAYAILNFLAPEKSGKHRFVYENIDHLTSFLLEKYAFSINFLERSSVYDFFEYAIRQFNLAPNSDAYLVFLMDFVLEVEQKIGVGAQAFLAQWEKKKETLAIASSENVNAIRIMTIHKAKGLEFPVVVFPFANELIYNRREKKMWAPTTSEVLKGFDPVLLNEKEEVSKYSNQSSEVFQKEKLKMQLDALNVLYVALTRAEIALYIVSEKKSNPKKNQKISQYSELFIDYLVQKGIWSDTQNSYRFGELAENMDSKKPKEDKGPLNYQYSYKERPDFMLVTKGELRWNTNREEAITHGNLIHYILGQIETHKDFEKVIHEIRRNGDVNQEQIKTIQTGVRQVLDHPDLHEFFNEGLEVFNERDILRHDGRQLRPDRIVIHNGVATILDYKTGKKNVTYREQLYEYSDALSEMGYTVKNKIIVYINERVTPEFI